MKLLAVLCCLVAAAVALPYPDVDFLYNDIVEVVNMQQSSWKVTGFALK